MSFQARRFACTRTCCRRRTARRPSPSTPSTRLPAATRSFRGRRRSPTTTSSSRASGTTTSRPPSAATSRGCTASRSRTTRRRATASFISIFPSRGSSLPGQFIPGADSHSRAYGAYGAVGIGVGSTTLGFGWSTGYIYFTVASARRVVVRRPAATVGQRQGHRARAAAPVGRPAVAGHVGGVRRSQRAAADGLSQHDRQHDGGGRGVERHLRGRRHHAGLVSREGHCVDLPVSAVPAGGRCALRDRRDARSVGRAADDRQAVQPGKRVSRRPRSRRERITFDKALIGSCTNGSYDDLLSAALVIRAARERGATRAATVFVIFPGSGGVGRQIEQPDARLGGESIAAVFQSVGGQVRQSWCGPCFGQGPDALEKGRARHHVLQPELAEPHGPRRRRVSGESRGRGARRRCSATWRLPTSSAWPGTRRISVSDSSPDSLQEIAEEIGVPVARRHIFLCCDQTKPKCCEQERGEAGLGIPEAPAEGAGPRRSRAASFAPRPTAFASARADRLPSSIPKARGTRDAIRRCSSESSASTSSRDVS